MVEMGSRGFWVGCVAAAAVGVVASLVATPHGLGVTPDSLTYLQAADSLRQGTGFRAPNGDGLIVPLTHYPPLYPAVLALGAHAGLDLMTSARAVAVVAAAGNVVAVGATTLWFTQSTATALAAASLVACSVDMLFLNTAAWSDALFIFLAVGCLSSVTLFLGRGRARWLIGAGAAGALAWLDRWVGGSVVVAGTLAVLLLAPGNVKRRVLAAAGFVLFASTPPIGWMIRNVLLSGSATNRGADASRASIGHVAALAQTVSAWLLPGTNRLSIMPGQDVIVELSALLMGGFFVWAAIRWTLPRLRDRESIVRTPVAFLLFAVVYFVSVLAATVFDASTPMDDRVLSPAYVATLIVGAYVAHRAYHAWARRARLGSVGLLLALILGNGIVTAGVAVHFRREGRGYVGPAWSYPRLRSELSTIDPDVPMYSNHPAAVEFALGRRARGATRTALETGIRARGEVILVYFDDPRSYAPRHALADKQVLSTAAHREELIAPFSPTSPIQERNGYLYELRPRDVS
jgi:hypothetical protein